METGAYNIVEDTQAYPRYAAAMSIVLRQKANDWLTVSLWF